MPLVKFDREYNSNERYGYNLVIVIDDIEVDVISRDETKEIFILPGIHKVYLKGEGLAFYMKSDIYEIDVHETHDFMYIIETSYSSIFGISFYIFLCPLWLLVAKEYNISIVFFLILHVGLLFLYHKKIGFKNVVSIRAF